MKAKIISKFPLVIGLALGLLVFWLAITPCSASNGLSFIGGHDPGDCCEYDDPGFCGHAQGGTCPSGTNINYCQKTYGLGRCDPDGSGNTPCDVDGCANQDMEPEMCSTDPYS